MRPKRLIWLAFVFITAVTAFLFLPFNRSGIREENVLVPIEIVNIPPGLTLLEISSNDIEIRIHGPETGGDSFKPPAAYTIDLSNTPEGPSTIPIEKAAFQLANGIELKKIDPQFILVKLEKILSRQLPVSIVTTGKVAPECYISEMVVSPASVIIRGPKSAIASMEMVPTKPIDIDGLQESTKKETSLNLPDHVEADLTPAIVLIDIFVKEAIISRKYENIAVKSKGSPLQVSISPSAINLEITGPRKVLDRLENEGRIEPYVDCTGLQPGVFARPAIISLPLKTALEKAYPEIFTVTITVQNPSGD